MSKELLLVLETVANEKDISKDLLFEAMEEALAIITKKELDEHMNIEVKIDRVTVISRLIEFGILFLKMKI